MISFLKIEQLAREIVESIHNCINPPRFLARPNEPGPSEQIRSRSQQILEKCTEMRSKSVKHGHV